MACGDFPLLEPWKIPGYIVCVVVQTLVDFLRALIFSITVGIIQAAVLVGDVFVAMIDGVRAAAELVGNGLIAAADLLTRGLGIASPLAIVVVVVAAMAWVYVGVVAGKFLIERAYELL